VGTASTGYAQNLVFRKNGVLAGHGSAGLRLRAQSMSDGVRTRVTPFASSPYYDGINDESLWRCDVLYGVKAVDPRLATRLSGT
jgi:hypothetical protein